jgi:N-glycosylase/DNA lyase
MINRLCQFYGESIVIDDDDGVKQEYFDFPSLSSMCNDDVEQRLRTAAFGYRARYIAKAAQQLKDRGGECWLRSLIGTEHVDARRNLMTITGIGPKVSRWFHFEYCKQGKKLFWT